MNTKKITCLASLLLTLFVAGPAFGSTVVISDNFNLTGTNASPSTGFGATGVNYQITNRLTGTVPKTLTYVATDATKAATAYSITNNKLTVASAGSPGRFVLSANGSAAYDFGPALGIAAASPTNPAIYDISVKMRNQSSGTQRCSFALGTTEGNNSTWDFGMQVFKAASGDNFYTFADRIDTGSSGSGDLTTNIFTNAPGSGLPEFTVLIHVTDAGAESGTNYNSRIQLSLDGTTNWIYDTLNDVTLTNGMTHWRLDGGARIIMWDIAPSAGPVTYDNFSITAISTPVVAARTWSGAGADDNWSTGDNWQGIAPAVGDSLVFDGTARQINFNDIAGLISPSVAFNTGGFTLGGLPLAITGSVTNFAGTNTFAGDLSWSNATAKTWSIASGSEVVLNNTNSVEVNGDHSISGGGNLRLKGVMGIGVASSANPAFVVNEGAHIIDGGTFTSKGGYRIGSVSTGIGAKTILTNNASMSLTTSGGNFRVGDSANPITSQLIIDNSTLTMAGGVFAIPYAAGATSIVSQVGGKVSGAIVSFSNAGAGKGTYNIKDGVLEAIQIREDVNGSSTISFDNATLRTFAGASNAFMSGLNSATIQTGGLVLDATTDITVAQVLKGTGPLIKSNSATTVTLTGANTYSGNTIIQSGKLVLSTAQSSAGTVQVGDGAELGVAIKTIGSTLNVGGLQFNGASFGTATFDLATFTNPTNAIMHATNMAISGPVTINVLNGVQLTIGQIVLIDYDGSMVGDFANFSLGTLPSGVSAELVNNTANGSIDLNITGVPVLRWTGALSTDWDHATANWLDLQTATASTFTDQKPVEFRDDATTGSVNLALDFITPSTILVSNNTLPYVWSGGPLTASLIKKYGTNSLTRVESAADIVTSFELNEGSFVISNTSAGTFATILTDTTPGLGALVKKGSGTLTITSTNSTYDGAVVISEGKVKLTPDRSLGSTNATITIQNGATMDLNDAQPGFEPVIVSGAGVGGAGAIIDSAGTGTGTVDANLRNVTMVGDTTLGATAANNRWDLRVRTGTGPGPGLKGNGYNLTKVGLGTVSIACQRNIGVNTPYWNLNLGDVVINAGSLAFAESLTLGNPSKTITINSGASIQLYDLGFTNPLVRNIFITSATLNCGGADDHTNVVNGSINLTGADSFHPDQCALIVNGPVVGSGSLAIYANEPGRVYLNGVNTYPGDTTVTNGTLGGSGSIAGNLVMLGGTNSPGMSSIATFTVNGNASLGGTTLMELNRGQAQNSDRLAVGGNLTFGGVLRVVLAAGASAPQGNDVYQLFNKGGSGTFTSINLPSLSAGLSWDTSKLSVDGSIKVNGTASSPNITSSGVSDGNFIMAGTGGVQGNNYVVLSSTNLALPISSWTPVVTNVFGPGGSFGFTNPISADPATFYLLQVP